MPYLDVTLFGRVRQGRQTRASRLLQHPTARHTQHEVMTPKSGFGDQKRHTLTEGFDTADLKKAKALLDEQSLSVRLLNFAR